MTEFGMFRAVAAFVPQESFAEIPGLYLKTKTLSFNS